MIVVLLKMPFYNVIMSIWSTFYVNWRDVQRKHVADKADRVTFKGTITKWHVQKQKCRTVQYTQTSKTTNV